MSLNIDELKNKLNQLSNRARISDILWKPQEGNNVVRIVPLASNPENPFIEAYFHYLGGKTYLSPLTFGDPDPIEEFAQKLRSGGNLSKEEYNETRKFVPKLRTYAPVVVRGQESEGVRFWGFGKSVYTEILSYIADDEYGDITHPQNGRDLKIEFTPAEKSDTKFPKSKVRASIKESSVTDDKALLEKILTVQPNLFDYYDRLSYEDLEKVLKNYLTPTEEEERTTVSTDDWGEPTEPTEPDTPSTTNKKESSGGASKSKNVEADFEKLFNS